VVLVVIKHLSDFLFCSLDLLLCSFDHDLVDFFGRVRKIGCLSLFNWMRFYYFRLLSYHSFEFLTSRVKSENFSHAMVSVNHVSLTPSSVFKASLLTWAIDIIWKTVLHLICITSDSLSHLEWKCAIYTHLIVCFNLEILIGIIEDAI
jgi:hypothetical protein